MSSHENKYFKYYAQHMCDLVYMHRTHSVTLLPLGISGNASMRTLHFFFAHIVFSLPHAVTNSSGQMVRKYLQMVRKCVCVLRYKLQSLSQKLDKRGKAIKFLKGTPTIKTRLAY